MSVYRKNERALVPATGKITLSRSPVAGQMPFGTSIGRPSVTLPQRTGGSRGFAVADLTAGSVPGVLQKPLRRMVMVCGVMWQSPILSEDAHHDQEAG